METVREPLVILRADLRVETANRAFYEAFQVVAQETEGRLVYELGNGQWNIPSLRKMLEEILPTCSTLKDYEMEHDFPGFGPRAMLLNARTLRQKTGLPERILLVIEDITERKRTGKSLRKDEAPEPGRS